MGASAASSLSCTVMTYCSCLQSSGYHMYRVEFVDGTRHVSCHVTRVLPIPMTAISCVGRVVNHQLFLMDCLNHARDMDQSQPVLRSTCRASCDWLDKWWWREQGTGHTRKSCVLLCCAVLLCTILHCVVLVCTSARTFHDLHLWIRFELDYPLLLGCTILLAGCLGRTAS